MSPIFNTEEERLAYLIDVNAVEGIQQLQSFVMSANNAAQALQRLTAVTQEYAKLAGVSFNQARQSLASLNATYQQAVASGNALGSGVGGGGWASGGGGGFSGSGGIGGIAPTLNTIPPAAKNAESSLSKLGNTFRHVIVGMIAFRIIQFFMDIVAGIGAATKAAQDFYKSLVNLEMGVRAMQRAGLDVTLNDFLKAIKDLKAQFPVFTEAQLASGFDNAILKTAKMKMSYEDVIKLMEISAGVAAVTGKSMESVTDALINAMLSSSGRMTITLAEATNLQINQADIARKAKELQIASIEKGIKALSNEERKTVILALAWEQYKKKQDDINASMETAPARVDAVTARWEDFKKELGYIFLMVKASVAPAMLGFLDSLVKSVSAAVQGFAQMIAALNVLIKLTDPFFGKGFATADELKSAWKTSYDAVIKAFDPANAGTKIEQTFGELGKNAGDAFAEGLTEEQQTALDEFDKNISDFIRDRDRKLAQDKIDLDRKLTDIDLKYQEDQIQDQIKYQRDVLDINEKATQDTADAGQKYRDNELKAEADYQRKLQDLRDKFLFDLEDALRERDARQVLRLIRQYQLDKKNIVKDATDQKTERAKQLVNELADIEKQRQRKLADAAKDYAYQQQKTYENWLQDRADAQTRFEQDQMDEQLRNKQKLQDLVDALADQDLATQAGADAIRKTLMQYFGPGGYTDEIYNYFIAKVQYAATMARMLADAALSSNWPTAPKTTGGGYRYASGGAMIASKPTTATFGEGGEPELAVFLPLSKIRNPVGNTSTRNIGGTGGKINLEVLLSPDLEARIVRQAANNVATTITRTQREK
jgi:hypothetical protein